MPKTSFTHEGRQYVEPTKDDLKKGAPMREEIEGMLDAWAPNHISDGRVISYEDWIDQALEGVDLNDGRRLTCGDNLASFPYTSIRRIAEGVAKDHR